MIKVFDYRCDKCGLTFEMFSHRRADDKAAECPECGEMADRTPSPTRTTLPVNDDGFPSAWHKWADDKERTYRDNAERHPEERT